MLITDDQWIQLTRGGVQRIDRRIDTLGSDITAQYHGRIQVREGGGWRRISQVIRRHVDRLDRRNRAVLGGGDTLLQLTHLLGQGRLITYRGRHTAQQSGNFSTRQGVTVDVVNEQQYVTTFVTELLGYGEASQGHTQTVSGRLVHLAVNHRHLIKDVGVLHFVVEVVTFTSPLTNACEYGETGVLFRDVVDQFHHVNGLAYTGATEQANLTTLGKRADQVDNLDAGFQQVCRRCLVRVAWSFAVDTPALFFADRALFVDRTTQNVHDTAQGLGTNRYRDCLACVFCFQASLNAVSAAHGDGTNDSVTQLLLDFQSCFATFKQQCVIYLGYGVTWKFHVDNRANDLNDLSATHARFLVILSSQ